MSKNVDIKVLKHADVHKKILTSPPVIRPKEEQMGPLNKYRDELFERYTRKKNLFFEASKKYNRLNQETLICSKKRLLEDYRENLECEDLTDSDGEECKDYCPCQICPSNEAKLYRMRTERPIHEVLEPPNDPCCIEPWFKRYLILNKFIWAGRKIILQNRLLKVLEKLKTVNAETIEELEKCQRRFLNVGYAEIFEKFM